MLEVQSGAGDRHRKPRDGSFSRLGHVNSDLAAGETELVGVAARLQLERRRPQGAKVLPGCAKAVRSRRLDVVEAEVAVASGGDCTCLETADLRFEQDLHSAEPRAPARHAAFHERSGEHAVERQRKLHGFAFVYFNREGASGHVAASFELHAVDPGNDLQEVTAVGSRRVLENVRARAGSDNDAVQRGAREAVGHRAGNSIQDRFQRKVGHSRRVGRYLHGVGRGAAVAEQFRRDHVRSDAHVFHPVLAVAVRVRHERAAVSSRRHRGSAESCLAQVGYTPQDGVTLRLQSDVQRSCLSGLQRQSVVRRIGHVADGRGRHHVVSAQQPRDLVAAGRIRARRGYRARRVVRGHNGGAGHGFAVVLHRAANAGRSLQGQKLSYGLSRFQGCDGGWTGQSVQGGRHAVRPRGQVREREVAERVALRGERRAAEPVSADLRAGCRQARRRQRHGAENGVGPGGESDVLLHVLPVQRNRPEHRVLEAGLLKAEQELFSRLQIFEGVRSGHVGCVQSDKRRVTGLEEPDDDVRECQAVQPYCTKDGRLSRHEPQLHGGAVEFRKRGLGLRRPVAWSAARHLHGARGKVGEAEATLLVR